MDVTPAKRGKRDDKVAEDETGRTPAQRHVAMTWAQRLKRVFNIDVEICSNCGGAMKIIACIEDPDVIQKILAHLDSVIPVPLTAILPESRAPPQISLLDTF